MDTFRPTPEELMECLTAACLNNRPQIAQYLLDRGARINYLTGFAVRYRGKSIEIFEVLVKVIGISMVQLDLLCPS